MERSREQKINQHYNNVVKIIYDFRTVEHDENLCMNSDHVLEYVLDGIKKLLLATETELDNILDEQLTNTTLRSSVHQLAQTLKK
jgi:hypothetical protein